MCIRDRNKPDALFVYCFKPFFFLQFFSKQYKRPLFSSIRRCGTCLRYDFSSVLFGVFYGLTGSCFILKSALDTFIQVPFLDSPNSIPTNIQYFYDLGVLFILVQYFTNWIEKSFSFIPISKYFSLNV